MIFSTLDGKIFSNFKSVIHNEALVLEALSLYFKESKKVTSFFFAECSGLTELMMKFFFILLLGKIFFT